MKRTDYETLSMEEIVVEMENGFLSGSTDVRNEENYGIKNQTINNNFSLDGDDEDIFADGTWE